MIPVPFSCTKDVYTFERFDVITVYKYFKNYIERASKSRHIVTTWALRNRAILPQYCVIGGDAPQPGIPIWIATIIVIPESSAWII